MRITKHEHAALEVVDDDATLIIDPGKFTPLFDDATGVAAVVVTHEHDDHWTPEQLDGIRAKSPHVRILGPDGVVRAAAAAGIEVERVAPGDAVEVGPFRLRFFGGKHAVIHESLPVIDNVGVLVNDALYYAGDSFVEPGVPVEVLAAPANAPWMKVSEVMDYVVAVAPRQAFGTHEMLLSPPGKALANARLTWATEQGGGTYSALEPGDAIEA
ncbi:MBL fold metallo-hydrolase [Agromyces sp. MMS24-K17]|uniref:MBL fold metallo-hydrolase n=1 Tax=Agromyces sp. MMS24-K17 TaxID=3372850 RepID=UPI003754E2C8